LGIVLVIGSMISLGYYLRVVATLWMRDEVPAPGPARRNPFLGRGGLAPIAGGSPEADEQDGLGAVRAGTGSGAGAVAPAARSGGASGRAAPEVAAVAVVFATASVVFGIFPQPLFELAAHAGRALGLP
ncbi:MAG: hypothetical protein ACJ780_21225, partial [Solirubrobacteraceae bacterium]